MLAGKEKLFVDDKALEKYKNMGEIKQRLGESLPIGLWNSTQRIAHDSKK